MKQLTDLNLTSQQSLALTELRQKLADEFAVSEVILYGSVARGEAGEESDIDLLIVTPQPLSRTARHEITDAVFEVNLRYGTNFSTLVVDRASWESGLISALPIREAILREGVLL
ncbi:MAG: nucleotidyltransferase domain-containing protein [Candidatus Latescibacteria bacterium]|nr:nucleotidyltransferase domain-containing protein [Candidatus Latescibacterota bacterium]